MSQVNSFAAAQCAGHQGLTVDPKPFGVALVIVVALATFAASANLSAQASEVVRSPSSRTLADSANLDSLTAAALRTSPLIKAAVARVDAARHLVAPAAAWSDPTLTAGVVNLPLGKEPSTISAHGTPTPNNGPDPMTMRVIGVTQTIPYPGKLKLERAIAQHNVDAADAAVETARRQVVRDIKSAYYEIAFLDRALAVVDENQAVLETLIRTTEARYGVGQGSQQEVLKARIDATHLAESASSLVEQRRAAVARLNAVLSRPSDTPMQPADIPASVERAALGDSSQETRFASAVLGARVADSPLPPLGTLQELAIENNPELREHEAMIAAQTARLELSRKSVLPDVDLSVQYGQRGGALPDMLTATVSVPIPLHKQRKQDEQVASASSTLASLHAEHDAKVNALRADIARLVSGLEQERTQLALYRKAILPQSRATVTTSAASYQVGKLELAAVLDSQSMLFTYETNYFRALTDFATNLAELERVVGKEILP